MKLNKAAFSLIHLIFLSVNNLFPQTSDIRPFELKTGREAAIISTGAAIGITGLIVILNNDRLTKDEINSLVPDDVNKFDRVAIGPYQKDMLGDALLYSSYLFPLSFLTYDETKNDFSTLALMYGEVLLINHSLNALVKGWTKKTRPFVYDNTSPSEETFSVNARHSFYSGHTSTTASNSFFTAKIFSEYLTDNTARTLIWTAAVIIPAVTGFSRVNTHNHFPTDVIIGYIVGAAIGYLIPELHKSETNGNVVAAPQEFKYRPVFGFQFQF